MAVKYKILFKDIRDNDCSVVFDFADYSEDDITILEGASIPLKITYDGDQTDLFQPIITSKANINVLINENTMQFARDVRDIDDKQVTVIANYGNGKKWIGNLISDENYEKFDTTGYFMSLTCVDPFSYLKSDDKKILSTNTSILGIATLYSFISAIISESGFTIPISIINDYKPDYSGSTDILRSSYVYTNTFFEDGSLPSGYDIISKIMTSLCMTCVIDNGVVYMINHRSHLSYSPKIIGEKVYGDENYLINNSEVITRTRGAKQLSVKYDYGTKGSVINNGYFYFYNPDGATLGSEITTWNYPTGSDNQFTGCTIERVGLGTNDAPYGVKISGINTSTMSTDYLWMHTTISPISDQNTQYYRLTVKYKYQPYNNRGGDGNTHSIYYSMNILFTDSSGVVYSYKYTGDSNLNPNIDGSTGQFNNYSTPGGQIKFPLNNKGGESTFDLCMLAYSPIGINFGTPPYTFVIELLPIRQADNNDFINYVGSANMPDSIIIESVELFADIRTISEESAPLGQYGNLYKYDSTTIRNNKNLSLVDDEVDIYLGSKHVFRSYPNGVEVPFSMSNGSLFTQSREFIENITNGSITDKIVSVVAKDRMFFERQPRYKIDCEVKSDNLSFVDILQFKENGTDLLPNVYTILNNDIDVRNCTHHIIAQELTGSDNTNDIIENNLIP